MLESEARLVKTNGESCVQNLVEGTCRGVAERSCNGREVACLHYIVCNGSCTRVL